MTLPVQTLVHPAANTVLRAPFVADARSIATGRGPSIAERA